MVMLRLNKSGIDWSENLSNWFHFLVIESDFIFSNLPPFEDWQPFFNNRLCYIYGCRTL